MKTDKKVEKKEPIKKIILRKFLKTLMYIGLKPTYWVKVEGKENFIDGPAIVCSNHLSALDPLFVLMNKDKNVNFFSKKEILNSWFGRMITYAFNMIPTNRDGNDTKAIKEGFKALSNNKIIGIYPEGTRKGLKDNNFNSGAVYIALKKDVPIIPMGLTGDIKPFKKIVMKIGKPIYMKELLKENKSIKDKDEIDRLTKVLLKEILSLTGEEQYEDIKQKLNSGEFEIK